LVVDDDAAIRQLLQCVLEDAGYAVSTARDGKEALTNLRAHPHRYVVLLDLHMPVMDGLAVLQIVEDDSRLANRNAFIIVTAEHGGVPPASRPQLKRLGIPVLAKPFRITQVLAEVAAAAQHLPQADAEQR
jgi:two-component system chemotaxis response regulator CheY